MNLLARVYPPGFPCKPHFCPNEVTPTSSIRGCRSSLDFFFSEGLMAKSGPPLSPWQASDPSVKKKQKFRFYFCNKKKEKIQFPPDLLRKHIYVCLEEYLYILCKIVGNLC